MRVYRCILTVGILAISMSLSGQSLEDARQAIDAEQYQSAKSMLKALLVSQPKSGDAYYSLGSVYLKTGYIDSARSTFTQGIRAQSKNPLNHVGLGELELYSGNSTGAKLNFDKAENLSPRRKYEAQLAISAAFLASPNSDFNTALPYLKKADELDKADKDPRIFLALGDYYALQRNDAAALEEYYKVLGIDSNFFRAGVQIARLYISTGQPAKGDSVLKDVLAKRPNYGPAYKLASETYKQRYLSAPEDRNAAIQAAANYRRYLEATDKSFDSRLKFAMLLYELKDFQSLEQELSKLNTVGPTHPKSGIVSRLRGYTSYEIGNHPAALQYMNMLFNSMGDKGGITAMDHMYMSLIQQKLKQPALAIDHATKAIKRDSASTLALESIAKAYYNERNWGSTIESYELIRSLDGQPEDVAELSLLHGTALFFKYVEAFNRGESPAINLLSQAKALFDEALKHSPGKAAAQLWNARTLMLLEDVPQSRALMVASYQAYIDATERSMVVQSAATKRSLIEAYKAIAGHAYAVNDREKARVYWNKTLVLDPMDATAVAGLKSISGSGRNR